MKPRHRALTKQTKDETKTILAIGAIILLLQLVFHLTVGAKPQSPLGSLSTDTLSKELSAQLDRPDVIKRFNFPNTVRRFYAQGNLQPVWLKSDRNGGSTALAMLLLDCVKQYGLQPQDYHREVLTYEKMYNVFSTENQLSTAQKIEFEIMLTDAMISMINYLHYGAFNPAFNRSSLDDLSKTRLAADTLLHSAIKSEDLSASILDVQPKIEQYVKLQQYMKLIVGQYTCDSYETPEQEIRTIAMNMERLRWLEVKASSYLLVNIPSFNLTYYSPTKKLSYKVVVGKVSTPTPTLTSSVNYLETAPDWRVPHEIFINEILPKAQKDLKYIENNHYAIYDEKELFIPISAQNLKQIRQNPTRYHARQTAGCDNALGKVVFRFNNTQSIYLHDTPEQQYFSRSKRALSHGCIRVSDAEQLAAMLLEDDGQTAKVVELKKSMANYSKQKFMLNKPLPIIIAYLTITVEDGLLVNYNDIYAQDKALENKMFSNIQQQTSKNIK